MPGGTAVLLLCRRRRLFLLLLVLVLVVVGAGGQRIRYHVSNEARGTPGGDLFDTVGGEAIVRRHLPLATALVWMILNISSPAYTDVFVKIDHLHKSGVVGAAVLNNITLDPERYPGHNTTGDLPEFMLAVLYHEVTHVWQIAGIFSYAPVVRGILEGTANYVSFLAGYRKQLCGDQGDMEYAVGRSRNWYVGYCPTALFFEYLINTSNLDFLVNLDSGLRRQPYTDDLFLESLGLYDKMPDELWAEFVRNFTGGGPNPRLLQFPRDLSHLPRNY